MRFDFHYPTNFSSYLQQNRVKVECDDNFLKTELINQPEEKLTDY